MENENKPETQQPEPQIVKDVNGLKMVDKTVEDIHLSPSQINTFKRCMAVWYFRYVEGRKVPPSAALTLGSCYDDALTTNYEQKMKTKEDMKVDEVIDAFNKSFEIRKDETDFTIDSKEDTRNIGQGLVKKYQEEVAPSIIPVVAQRKYDIKFEGVNWKLVCISDIETADNITIDNKTTGKSPSVSKTTNQLVISQDHLFQIYTYAIAKIKTDKVVPKLRIDYAVKTKIPKIVQAVIDDITQPDIEYFNKITATVYRAMELLKEGAMAPIPDRSNMLCSRRHCGFWGRCEELFGGRVKE